MNCSPEPSGCGREARASSKRKRNRGNIGKELLSDSNRRNTSARVHDVEEAFQLTPQTDTFETTPSVLSRTLRSSHCHPACSKQPRPTQAFSMHWTWLSVLPSMRSREQKEEGKATRRIDREYTKFKCEARHKSFVFPTDKNSPMASSRTDLNPARRTLFVAAMKKGKNSRKKNEAPVDDSSEDEVIERTVCSIARDTSPQEEQPSPSSHGSPSSAESSEEGPLETSPLTINCPPPSPAEAPMETAEEEISRLKDEVRKLQHNFEHLFEQNDSRNTTADDEGGQNKRFQEAIESAIEGFASTTTNDLSGGSRSGAANSWHRPFFRL